MKTLYGSRTNFLRLLNTLHQDYVVLVPVKKGDRRHYERLSQLFSENHGAENLPADGSGMAADGARTVEPLKAFCFNARQRVAEDFTDRLPDGRRKPLCIVGARACDLAAFAILDSVFLDSDYTDPFYAGARQDNLVIAADCTQALDVCFCLAVGGKPYATEGCDIGISEIDTGLLIESHSERGSRLLEQHAASLREATNEEIEARERLRGSVVDQVQENIRVNEIPNQDQLSGAIRASYEDALWREEAEACVECGACNAICPTCHCFQLFDQLEDGRLSRYRLWDSCLIKDFAQVAGGANPRPELWMRLRNRFEKKFDFFPARIGRYACTGCGRCIRACPAKIDIRRVLRRNVENVRAH